MDHGYSAHSLRTMLRLMAGFCMVLALMCVGLAVAYARKAEQVACYADAADLGLAPPKACETGR